MTPSIDLDFLRATQDAYILVTILLMALCLNNKGGGGDDGIRFS